MVAGEVRGQEKSSAATRWSWFPISFDWRAAKVPFSLDAFALIFGNAFSLAVSIIGSCVMTNADVAAWFYVPVKFHIPVGISIVVAGVLGIGICTWKSFKRASEVDQLRSELESTKELVIKQDDELSEAQANLDLIGALIPRMLDQITARIGDQLNVRNAETVRIFSIYAQGRYSPVSRFRPKKMDAPRILLRDCQAIKDAQDKGSLYISEFPENWLKKKEIVNGLAVECFDGHDSPNHVFLKTLRSPATNEIEYLFFFDSPETNIDDERIQAIESWMESHEPSICRELDSFKPWFPSPRLAKESNL